MVIEGNWLITKQHCIIIVILGEFHCNSLIYITYSCNREIYMKNGPWRIYQFRSGLSARVNPDIMHMKHENPSQRVKGGVNLREKAELVWKVF